MTSNVKRISRIGLLALLLGLFFAAPRSVHAQQKSVVTGTVRSAAGDSLPNARIHATGAGVDTTVRANAKGVFGVVLPFGVAQLQVTYIGYVPGARSITVDRPETNADVSLTRIAQQLSAVNVRENWIGIRGVVGDSATMLPLANTVIQSLHRGIKITTDSLGRFEIPLEKAEQTALVLHRDGYLSRPAHVSMENGGATDLVLFMLPGKDRNDMKNALKDLDRRMTWAGIGSAMIDREQLSKYGAVRLPQALDESGILTRRGLKLPHDTIGKSNGVCLFVDGRARVNWPLSSVIVSNVDFVEVYGFGADEGRSLLALWPLNEQCDRSNVRPNALTRATVQLISVWTRK